MPVFHRLDKALHWLRIEQGRKQSEVARRAGVTPAMLSSYERGKEQPSLASLGKVLDALGVGLGELEEALARHAGDGRAVTGPSSAATDTVHQRRSPPAVATTAKPAPGPPGSAEGTLYSLLGSDRRMPPDAEAALALMVEGFQRWLRLLHATTPDRRRENGNDGS